MMPISRLWCSIYICIYTPLINIYKVPVFVTLPLCLFLYSEGQKCAGFEPASFPPFPPSVFTTPLPSPAPSVPLTQSVQTASRTAVHPHLRPAPPLKYHLILPRQPASGRGSRSHKYHRASRRSITPQPLTSPTVLSGFAKYKNPVCPRLFIALDGRRIGSV